MDSNSKKTSAATSPLLPKSFEIMSVKNIDLRMGSDDESGLTKALDSVFPEATRLLCIKHMKDNVSEYLKNSIGSTDKQRSDIILNVLLKLSLQLSLPSQHLERTHWDQICLLVQEPGVGYLHAYQTQKGQYGWRFQERVGKY
jgi:hypothetical protein